MSTFSAKISLQPKMHQALDKLAGELILHEQEHVKFEQQDCVLLFEKVSNLLQSLVDIELGDGSRLSVVSKLCVFVRMTFGPQNIECKVMENALDTQKNSVWLLNFLIKILELSPMHPIIYIHDSIISTFDAILMLWSSSHPQLLVSVFNDFISLLQDLFILRRLLSSNMIVAEEKIHEIENNTAGYSESKGSSNESAKEYMSDYSCSITLFRSSASLLNSKPGTISLSKIPEVLNCLSLIVLLSSSTSATFPLYISILPTDVQLWLLLCEFIKIYVNERSDGNQSLHVAAVATMRSLALLRKGDSTMTKCVQYHLPQYALQLAIQLLTSKEFHEDQPGVNSTKTETDNCFMTLCDSTTEVLNSFENLSENEGSISSVSVSLCIEGIEAVAKWWKMIGSKSPPEDTFIDNHILLGKAILRIALNAFKEGKHGDLRQCLCIFDLIAVIPLQTEIVEIFHAVISTVPCLPKKAILATQHFMDISADEQIQNQNSSGDSEKIRNREHDRMNMQHLRAYAEGESKDITVRNDPIFSPIEPAEATELIIDIVKRGLSSCSFFQSTNFPEDSSLSENFSVLTCAIRSLFPFILEDVEKDQKVKVFSINLIRSYEICVQCALTLKQEKMSHYIYCAIVNCGLDLATLSSKNNFVEKAALSTGIIYAAKIIDGEINCNPPECNEVQNCKTHRKNLFEPVYESYSVSNLLHLPLLDRVFVLAACYPCSTDKYDNKLMIFRDIFSKALTHNSIEIRISAIHILPVYFENCGTEFVLHSEWHSVWEPLLVKIIQEQAIKAHLVKVIGKFAMVFRCLLKSNFAVEPRVKPYACEVGATDIKEDERNVDALVPLELLITNIIIDKSTEVSIAAVNLVMYLAENMSLQQLLAGGQGINQLLQHFLACTCSNDQEVMYASSSFAGILLKNDARAARALKNGADPEEAINNLVQYYKDKIFELGDFKMLATSDGFVAFQGVLEAVTSIGCEANSTNSLGLCTLTWSLISLIEIWVDHANPLSTETFRRVCRVCQYGHQPLISLLNISEHLDFPYQSSQSRGTGTPSNGAFDGSMGETEKSSALEVILPPLLEVLLEKGKVIPFFEQVLRVKNPAGYLHSVMRYVLPIFVSQCKGKALENLALLMGAVPPTHVATMLLQGVNFPHVLCYLLMGGSGKDGDGEAEFDFLLSFFPDNGPRNIIEAHLPDLLGLLSWELAGARHGAAASAIRGVAAVVDCKNASARRPALEEASQLLIASGISHGNIQRRKRRRNFQRNDPFSLNMEYLLENPDYVISFNDEADSDDESLECESGYSYEEEELDRDEELLITSHFLYLMSRVVYRKGMTRVSSEKVRAMHVLGRLTPYLLRSSIPNFIPKVLATVNSALSDPQGTPALRLMAYMVLFSFIRGIPSDVLGPCLSSTMVAVLPALSDDIAIARKMAIDLLYSIIVGKRQKLKSFYKTVPFFPVLPELEKVTEVLMEEIGHPILEDRLKQLSTLLHESSAPVRLAAMHHLLSVLEENRKEMQKLIQAFNFESKGNEIVTKLMEGLLKISSLDPDPIARQICASCLGELGAIDPALLPLSLATNSSNTDNKEKRNDLKVCWFQSKENLALELLSNQLVPSFRAAPDGIDRIAFGIQELLRTIFNACAPGTSREKRAIDSSSIELQPLLFIDIDGLVNSRTAGGTTWEALTFTIHDILQINGLLNYIFYFLVALHSSDLPLMGTQNSRTPMPDWLASMLGDYDILDAVEPLWGTSYVIKDVDFSWKLPFFYESGSQSLHGWLGSWCRHLCSRATGPLQSIFVACRGVVKAQISTAQFLLPYLVVDTILLGSDEDREHVHAEIMAVLVGRIEENATTKLNYNPQKIGIRESRLNQNNGSKLRADQCRQQLPVSYKGGQSIEHMAIQAIFTLLDTIKGWISIPNETSRVEGWPKDDDRRKAINDFLESIPLLSLVEASMKTRANTRALLYLEQHVRNKHNSIQRKDRTSNKTQVFYSRNDGANGLLPKLSASDLDMLQAIHHRLPEEPDGMAGLEAARRIEGLPGNLKNKIWHFEHSDCWSEAVQAYEQALQERNMSNSLMAASENVHSESNRDLGGSSWDSGELEKGLLHSVMKLGQFETVLQQASGVLAMPNGRDLAVSVLPQAVEAGWRLQSWTILSDLINQCNKEAMVCADKSLYIKDENSICTASSRLFGDGQQRIALGKVVLSLHQGIKENFKIELELARGEVMADLGAASMESYQRAYPFLLRLHCLRELEQGFDIIKSSPEIRDDVLHSYRWEERLNAVAPGLRNRETLMSVRRVIVDLAGLNDEVSNSWLRLAKDARVEGRWEVASAALRYARLRGGPLGVVTTQEGKLYHAQGNVYRALQVIEPIEIDADTLRERANTFDEDSRNDAARRLLLSTNWMVESGQKHGHAVIDRYKVVLELRPQWEKGYFGLGQYMDFLYRARISELPRKNSTTEPVVESNALGSRRKHKIAPAITRSKPLENDEFAHRYALETMDCYAKSLRYGSKFIFQAMPRLLTLWFEIGSASSTANSNSDESVFNSLRLDATKLVSEAISEVPLYMWYTCLPQLMSRVGHPCEEMLNVVITALANLLAAHPYQAMWQISGLCFSLNERRQRAGERIVQKAIKIMLDEGRNSDAQCIQDAKLLFQDLIKLAEERPANERTKEGTTNIGRRICLDKFVVPLQRVLTVSLPDSSKAYRSKKNYKPKSQSIEETYVHEHNPFPSAQVHIKKFNREIFFMCSKARPKKISLQVLETGQTVNFLCKQERKGDLRKDARLMEFGGMVNRLLQKCPKGRQRKLRLRTYAVICLNEECGMLEWVPNTTGLRQIVAEAAQYIDKVPSTNFNRTRMLVEAIQANNITPSKAVEMYRDNVLPLFPPCMHNWFTKRFREPTAWFEARTMFARSAAVWSGVGHVVGLGDRHGENILIDTNCGECVHVDFDCLFDKGLSLARPEIVPFRLTPNMVDAMGLTGYEGVYRLSLETTMQVLRENRETLLSVLDPFLQDPTVAWSRTGRAQRGDEALVFGGGGAVADNVNEDAKRVLRVIDERLRGMYNIKIDSNKAKILNLNPCQTDSVVSEMIELPLSVQGQVQRLIQEATSYQNLSQMYVGWMPWL